MGNNAWGKPGGSGFSGEDKAGPGRQRRAGQFQAMRAKARAGALHGKTYPRDELLGGEKPHSNYKPKTVNVMDEVVRRGKRINDPKSSNDPGKPVYKTTHKGFPPPS